MAWEDMPDALIAVLRERQQADWDSLSWERAMELNGKFHDAVRDAGYLLPSGYKVRRLTDEDIHRAASVVLAIASIPTLKDGVVGFEHGLEGGTWYVDHEHAHDREMYITADVPESLDLPSARAAVLEGLEDARSYTEEYVEDLDDRALELRALEVEGAMSDAVA